MGMARTEWVGRFTQEVSDERTWMDALLGCRTRRELLAELGALTRRLEDRFAAREAPGGLLEQALAFAPDDARVLHLGDAQRAAWQALHHALGRLQVDAEDDAGMGDVEAHLRRLRAAQEALLERLDADPEIWS